MPPVKVLLMLPTSVRKQVSLYSLPPLGLLGIASYLESKGIPTDVIDCHVTPEDPDFLQYGVVCLATNMANAQNTISYIKEIRQINPQAKIVIGGYQNVERARHWLTGYNVDLIIIGEGELTMHEYLTSDTLSSIKGILYKEGEEVIFTGERPLVMNLDTFPFPALDKVPIRKYNAPIKKLFPVSIISTSRGCPAKCTFCYAREGVWRQRSPKHVVDEIEWQVKELGVKELWVADDNFTLNRQRAWDIAQMIIDRGIHIKIQLKNGIRVDKVDRELLVKLKEAGVWLISVAPESGSQITLDRLQKGFTLDRVKEVTAWCKELGITTCALFIMGLPWETKEDFAQTVHFAHELDTDLAQFTRYTPIEGTPIYEEVKADGMLLDNQFEDISIQTGSLNYNSKKLGEKEMEGIYKKAYRGYYLRPRKMFAIFKMLSVKDIYLCMKFGVLSGSL